MRRFFLTVIITAGAALLAGTFMSYSKADTHPEERAVVEFTRTVKLKDVFLRGQYLIVHDDSRMAQGDACLYIYRQFLDKPDQLVISFHCRPVQRARVDKFKVTVSSLSPSLVVPEVREIQFAGADKAHQVP